MGYLDEILDASPTPTLSDDDFDELRAILAACESNQIQRHDLEWELRRQNRSWTDE